MFVSGPGSSRTETKHSVTLDGDCFDFPSPDKRTSLIRLDRYDRLCRDDTTTLVKQSR